MPDPETHEMDQTQPVAADLQSARRVLDAEAEAINSLGQALNASFIMALDIMNHTGGRVVVSGMGKSGHVGRKIASTLASTGTPALFVHPAEASHGDLGMITSIDSLFLLSNSGETPELVDLVNYATRFSIPVVGITGSEISALSKAADAALILPPAGEACPMGLAPTTSTTMMLALGDSLAVALLERRGFSPSDFHILHPGGKLGRRLLKIADIMHDGEELPLAAPTAPMSEVLLIMTAKRFGCVGITNTDGRFLGIITDGDLRRHMCPNLLSAKAGDVMTAAPTTIRPSALVSEALAIMNERAITNLFVVADEKPCGIIHIHDCLRAGIA
ncbi:MAG: KpsF/GutQ family sugar-phosphate isomerase [Magnetovibrio sp.]|nr:KpsF/GutQ family sugar-phosphate isomerase [Magnetovibrio sp.]